MGVSIVLGTGVGGGIILDGQVYKGAHFSSSEFSAVNTQLLSSDENVNTSFGYFGSAVILVKRVAAEVGEDIDKFHGKDMYRLIEEGNEAVIKIFREYCNLLVSQIMNFQAIIDPDKFVIGGGISASPILVKTINEIIEDLFENDEFLRGYTIKPSVVNSCLGNDANLYGALY
ncbi:hypothetical protein CKO19_16985, partial [Rhodovulum adriaticum]|nr:hypothetical protein [Rhodovulum adriaticum]